MEKDLTFEQMTHLVGVTVLNCDFAGNTVEEYVVEEYDAEHDWISVSRKLDNRVSTIWPEELYMWHFQHPGKHITTGEVKRCPLKFWECTRDCAWFDEKTGYCAVFSHFRIEKESGK